MILTEEQVEEVQSKHELVAWLGKYHVIPAEVDDKAMILVTDSRDITMIGEQYPVTVKEEEGVMEAWVNGYRVEGVISESSSSIAAPYEGGWVWGYPLKRNGDEVTIRALGGVGVATPPKVEGAPSHSWTVVVPRVFPMFGEADLPRFGDSPAVLDAKLQKRKLYLKEVEVQTVLIRQFMTRIADDDLNIDFPDFKHRNVWHVTMRPTLFALYGSGEGNPDPKVGNHVLASALERSETTFAKQNGIRFKGEMGTVTMDAPHPLEALRECENNLLAKVKGIYGFSAAVNDTSDCTITFGGVR